MSVPPDPAEATDELRRSGSNGPRHIVRVGGSRVSDGVTVTVTVTAGPDPVGLAHGPLPGEPVTAQPVTPPAAAPPATLPFTGLPVIALLLLAAALVGVGAPLRALARRPCPPPPGGSTCAEL